MKNARFCRNCGSPLEENHVFCSSCGKSINEEIITNIPSIPPVLPKSNNKNIFIIVSVILVVLLAAGAAYKFLVMDKDKEQVKINNSSETSEKSNSTKDDTVQTPEKSNSTKDDTVTSKLNLTDPKIYLHENGKKYTYYERYADATEQTIDIMVNKLEGVPIQTSAVLYAESEPSVNHVLSRSDGLYMVDDSNLDNLTKFLPEKIEVGKEWDGPGGKSKILKMNETVDLGFKKFENCILVQNNYTEVGVTINSWYAPQVGLVKSVYGDGGSPYQDLKSIAPMTEQETLQLKSFSVNILSVK